MRSRRNNIDASVPRQFAGFASAIAIALSFLSRGQQGPLAHMEVHSGMGRRPASGLRSLTRPFRMGRWSFPVERGRPRVLSGALPGLCIRSDAGSTKSSGLR